MFKEYCKIMGLMAGTIVFCLSFVWALKHVCDPIANWLTIHNYSIWWLCGPLVFIVISGITLHLAEWISHEEE